MSFTLQFIYLSHNSHVKARTCISLPKQIVDKGTFIDECLKFIDSHEHFLTRLPMSASIVIIDMSQHWQKSLHQVVTVFIPKILAPPALGSKLCTTLSYVHIHQHLYCLLLVTGHTTLKIALKPQSEENLHELEPHQGISRNQGASFIGIDSYKKPISVRLVHILAIYHVHLVLYEISVSVESY